MGPLDTLWHLLNLFAPAVSVGILASAMAKLLWWRRLKPVAWTSLSLWTTGVAAVALGAGLVIFGRDGRMTTYALMVLAGAAALWWAGFGRRH